MTEQEIDAIQCDIAYAKRDEFTDEELRIAFKETCHMEPEKIRKYILPQVYGNNFDYMDFDGMNCDDCNGASGFSKRCSCGNRRVYWSASDNALTAD